MSDPSATPPPEKAPPVLWPLVPRWAAWLLYAAALAGGLWFGFRPTLASGFAAMQTDPTDTVLNHYILEHEWRWLSDPGYPCSFWSPHFYYPTPLVLAYSENLLGTAALYWGLRPFFGEELSFQLWMILLAALNFAAMALVLRWRGLNHLFCALGGFLFAFGLPHIHQLWHVQLQPRLFAPFAVYYGWEFLSRPRTRSLVRLLAWTFLQVLAGIYLGWFLAFGLVLFSLAFAAVDRGTVGRVWRYLRSRPLPAAAAVALWAGGLAALFHPYFEANADERRGVKHAAMYLPEWRSWLAGPPGSMWEETLRPVAGDQLAERLNFSGFGVWLLVLLGAASLSGAGREDGRAKLVAACLLAAALLVLLATRWSGSFAPWWWVFEWFPGARALRVVSRVYFPVYLFAVVGGLAGAQALLERWRARPAWRAMACAALAAFAAAEQVRTDLPHFRRSAFYGEVERWRPQIRGADAVYALSGTDRHFVEHHLLTMWAGLRQNVPVLNGYSGRAPAGYALLWWRAEPNVPEVLAWLGPEWHGRLVFLRTGEPNTRWQYRVEVGPGPVQFWTFEEVSHW